MALLAVGAVAAVALVLPLGCTARSQPVAPSARPTPRTTIAADPKAAGPTPVDTTTQPGPSENLAGVPARLGRWVLVGRQEVLGLVADQGLASVRTAGGQVRVVYRGSLAVTPELRAQGWVHVGDPDSWQGWVVDAYQGPAGATSKMFEATSPTGAQTTVVHPLAPGEALNNSFAAISPDGRWTVSGEWGDEDRLLVFPTPGVNPEAVSGRPLALVGQIDLGHTVRDVQGCAFEDAAELLCSDSDPATDLWGVPDQLLAVRLHAPLGPGVTAASTSLVGRIPTVSPCSGVYEPEGLDIDRTAHILRIAVNPPPPCGIFTQIYEYRSAS